MFDQISGHHDSAKWALKVNYHRSEIHSITNNFDLLEKVEITEISIVIGRDIHMTKERCIFIKCFFF